MDNAGPLPQFCVITVIINPGPEDESISGLYGKVSREVPEVIEQEVNLYSQSLGFMKSESFADSQLTWGRVTSASCPNANPFETKSVQSIFQIQAEAETLFH